MKIVMIVGAVVTALFMAGCGKKSSGSPTTLPLGSKPSGVSDGSNTWYVGTVSINGTNVPVTNVAIQVTTN